MALKTGRSDGFLSPLRAFEVSASFTAEVQTKERARFPRPVGAGAARAGIISVSESPLIPTT
jgi:hypothetical protein